VKIAASSALERLDLGRSGRHDWDVRDNPAVFAAWRHAYGS
jgi:hypothetical protein